VATLGIEVVTRKTWAEMKVMMTEEFCPPEVIQRMEGSGRTYKEAVVVAVEITIVTGTITTTTATVTTTTTIVTTIKTSTETTKTIRGRAMLER
nr:hypothetical protein [Tanacetum cinerariifolium]